MKKEDFLGFDYKVSLVKKGVSYEEFNQTCKKEYPKCLFGRSRDGKTETCYTYEGKGEDETVVRHYIYEYRTKSIFKTLERVF